MQFINKSCGICYTAVITLIFSMCCSLAHAQSITPAQKKLQDGLNSDLHRNVGKTLPYGIRFTNNQGKLIDLHRALQGMQGPVVVIVTTTLHCPPCQKVVTYIKNHPDRVQDQKFDGKVVHFAFIRVKDSKQPSLSLPSNVLELHSAKSLKKGFLETHGFPAAFYFDPDMKLIKRQVVMFSPRSILHYPGSLPKE